MSSIRDVARLAGVSIGTVSRVLGNTTYPVNKETRERVLAAAANLAYVPNSAARALVTGASSAVGVIVQDITDPFFNEVTRGIEDAAAQSGYMILVGNADRSQQKLEQYLVTMLSHRPAGVILVGGQSRGEGLSVSLGNLLHRLLATGTQIVSIGRYEFDIPGVLVDENQVVQLAMDHLFNLGHRRIAFIGGTVDSTTAEGRLQAYRSALSLAGIPIDERLIVTSGFTLQAGRAAMDTLLQSGADFTATLAVNDDVAVGSLVSLRSHGMRVPEDVSLIGVNDIPFTAFCDPPLTSVHLPLREMGAAAWALMMDLRNDPAGNRLKRVETRLVVRKSTDRPRHRT